MKSIKVKIYDNIHVYNIMMWKIVAYSSDNFPSSSNSVYNKVENSIHTTIKESVRVPYYSVPYGIRFGNTFEITI